MSSCFTNELCYVSFLDFTDGNLVAVPLQHVINKVVFMAIMPKGKWVYLSQFPNLIEEDKLYLVLHVLSNQIM